MNPDHIMMPVERLREGYQVDLEDDPYTACTDPECSHAIEYTYEYAVVDSVEEETPGCTVVVFDNDWIGFPHGHMVRVAIASLTNTDERMMG